MRSMLLPRRKRRHSSISVRALSLCISDNGNVVAIGDDGGVVVYH